MKSEINRDTPLPLYYQLEKIIKEAITCGDLKPGDMLPTEMELMEIYSISRATVRHAVSNLENEGYLRKERAKGTFIKYPPLERKFMGNLKCFSEEMQRKGIPHSTLELEKSVIEANSQVGDRLQLKPGAPVFYLKRLRSVDESPVLIVQSYIPYEICSGIEKEDFNFSSLYDVLENQYGIFLRHGHRWIEPKIVDSDETIQLLNIKPGTCISSVESIIYSEDNRPVEYHYAEMIGKISIELGGS